MTKEIRVTAKPIVINNIETNNITNVSVPSIITNIDTTLNELTSVVPLDFDVILSGMGEEATLEPNLFKYLEETLNKLERISLSPDKIIADTFSSSEIKSFIVSKGITDTKSTSETIILTSGFNRIFNDVLTYAESILISIGHSRVFSDIIGYVDTLLILLDKGIIDTLSKTDLISFNITKIYNETSSVIENISLVLSKIFNDNNTIQDSQIITIGKNPVDTVITSELNSFDIGRGIIDTLVATDDVLGNANVDDDQTVWFDKTLKDNIYSSEVFDRTVSYDRQLIDPTILSEIISNNLDLFKTETLSKADIYEILVGRNITDAITLNEQITILLALNRIFLETVNKTDSGKINNQSYFAADYAADDYAGTTITF
jgi:hypothetical protein